MSKVGEWWVASVRAADIEDIKYLFTSGCYGTERGKGLSAIPDSKSGPAPAEWGSARVSGRLERLSDSDGSGWRSYLYPFISPGRGRIAPLNAARGSRLTPGPARPATRTSQDVAC